ncbi:MAG: hypothetical protein ACLTY9_09385, partial [Oscillospiraceae bacterium]
RFKLYDKIKLYQHHNADARRLSVSRRKKQRGSRPEDLPRVGAFISRDIQDSGKIFKKVANRAGNLPCSPFYKMVS